MERKYFQTSLNKIQHDKNSNLAAEMSKSSIKYFLKIKIKLKSKIRYRKDENVRNHPTLSLNLHK